MPKLSFFYPPPPLQKSVFYFQKCLTLHKCPQSAKCPRSQGVKLKLALTKIEAQHTHNHTHDYTHPASVCRPLRDATINDPPDDRISAGGAGGVL